MKNPFPFRYIGFCGRMASGKTTLAKALLNDPRFQDLMPEGERRVYVSSFADPIKEIADKLAPHTDVSYRELCQGIGDKGREMDINMWLNMLISDTSGDYCNLIDDVRFLNEAAWLLEHTHYGKYGFLFHLEVEESDRRRRAEKRENGRYGDTYWRKINCHKSERDINYIAERYVRHDFCYTIRQESDDISQYVDSMVDILTKLSTYNAS